MAVLFVARGATARVFSVLVFRLSFTTVFSASGIYDTAIVKPAGLQILHKIDHSAIFMLIAGTYTPFCLLAFTGFWHSSEPSPSLAS